MVHSRTLVAAGALRDGQVTADSKLNLFVAAGEGEEGTEKKNEALRRVTVSHSINPIGFSRPRPCWTLRTLN
jgi:hypothetical protein